MMTTATSTASAPIAMIFGSNDYFVLQALEGLTQEELWRSPTEHNNPMLWVAGHVAQTRATVLQMLWLDGFWDETLLAFKREAEREAAKERKMR